MITPISFVPYESKMSVGAVVHSSLYYKKGIREGDVVLSVNGKSIGISKVLSYDKFEKGEKYTFILLSPMASKKR